MRRKRPALRLFLDENVSDSVGKCFEKAGHIVIYLREAIATGSSDQLVCAAAEANDAILVAHDADMRAIAKRHGVGQHRFRRLSLIKLSCRESKAPARLDGAMSLIEHEWNYSTGNLGRRIFIEIGPDVIRTVR